MSDSNMPSYKTTSTFCHIRFLSFFFQFDSLQASRSIVRITNVFNFYSYHQIFYRTCDLCKYQYHTSNVYLYICCAKAQNFIDILFIDWFENVCHWFGLAYWIQEETRRFPSKHKEWHNSVQYNFLLCLPKFHSAHFIWLHIEINQFTMTFDSVMCNVIFRMISWVDNNFQTNDDGIRWADIVCGAIELQFGKPFLMNGEFEYKHIFIS